MAPPAPSLRMPTVLPDYSNGTCPAVYSVGPTLVVHFIEHLLHAQVTSYPRLRAMRTWDGLSDFISVISSRAFISAVFHLRLPDPSYPTPGKSSSQVTSTESQSKQKRERNRDQPWAMGLLSSTQARSIIDSISRLIKQSVSDHVKKAGTFSTRIDAIQDSGITDVGEALLRDVTRREREREGDRFTLMASSVSSPEENMLLTAADVLTSDPSWCKIMQIANS